MSQKIHPYHTDSSTTSTAFRLGFRGSSRAYTTAAALTSACVELFRVSTMTAGRAVQERVARSRVSRARSPLRSGFRIVSRVRSDVAHTRTGIRVTRSSRELALQRLQHYSSTAGQEVVELASVPLRRVRSALSARGCATWLPTSFRPRPRFRGHTLHRVRCRSLTGHALTASHGARK